MLFAFFEKHQERAKENFYVPVIQVIKQDAVKAFFIEGADELYIEKIHKAVEFQEFTQGFKRHFLRSPTFTAAVLCFSEHQDEKRQ